jgi:lysophospholipase L1-like esterase
MNNKQILAALIFVSIIVSLISIVVMAKDYGPQANNDYVNQGEYYWALGDSITAGKTTSDPQTDTYIAVMQSTYDPGHSVDHVREGYSNVNGGWSGTKSWHAEPPSGAWKYNDDVTPWANVSATRWQQYNESYNFTNPNTYYVFMFGTNDAAVNSTTYAGHPGWGSYVGNQTPNKVVENLSKLYTKLEDNGSIPVPCVMPGFRDLGDRAHTVYAYWGSYINNTIDNWSNLCIRTVPMWDALDLDTYNGRVDNTNTGWFSDRAHPNDAGHVQMAALLWYFINHYDYNETYYPGNETVLIQADYNQTIFVELQSGWDYSDVTVTCLNNATEVTWTQGTHLNGTQMICFDVEKGNDYNVQYQAAIQFISIDDGVNGTRIYDSTPIFNWTIVNDTTMYHLEISTNNSFVSLIVNLTNINEYNYPVEYTAGENISFILPNSNALPEYNVYYCRIRAYSI